MASKKRCAYNLALITGASSGLGTELARRLHERGTPLLLSGKDPDRLRALAEQIGAQWLVCDLSQSLSPLQALIRERAPDLLINCAGYTVYSNCLDAFEEQSSILRVNGTAPCELTLEAARAMQSRNRSGTVLNISSAAALLPFPAMASYAAAKALLASFSQSLDLELRSKNIRILVSLPGQIATPFAQRASGNPHLKTSFSMPVAAAARLLLAQLDRKIPYAILDRKVRILLLLSRLLPRAWLARSLQQEVLKRRN